MTKLKQVGLVLSALMLGLLAMDVGERLSVPGVRGYVTTAEARVGRPLTPVSVAGAARRTTRRAYGAAAYGAADGTAGDCVQVVDSYGRLVTQCY